jgi:hypothetical protein
MPMMTGTMAAEIDWNKVMEGGYRFMEFDHKMFAGSFEGSFEPGSVYSYCDPMLKPEPEPSRYAGNPNFGTW